MKEIPLILIGGGNSSIEIIDLINDINKIESEQFIKIIGILDNNKIIKKSINGVKVIGKFSDIKLFKKEKFFINIFHKDNRFIRIKLIKKFKINTSRFMSIIHPNSLIGGKAKIGAGVSIYPGCNIYSSTSIGNFCNFMPNSSIAPHVKIEENCFIGKDVIIAAGAKIKKNTYIGYNSSILEKTVIEEGCRVMPHTIVNLKIKQKKMIIGGSPARVLFKEKI